MRPRLVPDFSDIPGALDRARTAVAERAELPGMSLMEHLEELRKRLVHSFVYIVLGFFVAYGFHERIVGFMVAPITHALQANGMDTRLVYLNPIDPFNFFVKIAFFGGCILASPFVLYQVWLFISPGLYKHERRYVFPFMSATMSLFFAGAFFGYHFVYPGALKFLISFGHQFKPMVTITEYTQLFITVVLGLGIVFELPIFIFFLALFGIVSASFLWKNIRYAILLIFIVAAIIAPTPDALSMCVFAMPMLALYFIGIGVAYFVHPSRRKAKAQAA
jgi:sec-independent protein translocase protein TatC